MKADVIVIGGGAAGLMAAGTAGENGKSVVLLEPNDKLGRKLRITGKGRCNCTNDCSEKEFLSAVPGNPRFLQSVLYAFPPAAAMGFFENLGVPLKTERGRRVFPQSDSANELADALAAWALRGAKRVKQKASSLWLEDGVLRGVKTARENIEAASVIVCTGGKSYSATGSTGDGYVFARQAGHSIIPPRPSLVPLLCEEGFCADLAGFAPRNVKLTVLENGKSIYSELGEMLFSHQGVTGPLVLSASALMRRFGEADYELRIDFKPALDEKALDERLLRDFEKYANRDFANALGDLAARSFIPVLVEQSGIPGSTKVNSVTREQRQRLLRLLKAFPLHVTGPGRMEEAIVTAGGVCTKEINPRTMESKLCPGLYFAGEVLDVDAFTGGYNLQIAWSTARCAGMHA